LSFAFVRPFVKMLQASALLRGASPSLTTDGLSLRTLRLSSEISENK